MRISLIAAMSENRVIGQDNRLPWHMPADLKRFKRLTTGHAVVMGRRTFESIGCRPLPNRRNVVITRQRDYPFAGWPIEGTLAAHDLDQALDLVCNDAETFILGGQEIFELALPRADRLYLTLIHAQIEGDTFFPAFDPAQWKLIEDERHRADARHAFDYSFQTFERVG